MDASARRSSAFLAVIVAIAAAFVVAVPATAFDPAWTKPKRVFTHGSPPTHSMVTDDSANVHIASERGSSGVWYVSDTTGTWQECQVSSGNDRRPSIAVENGVVYIAFARLTDGQEGIYTAASDQASGSGGCGWTVRQRYSGSASHPSMDVFEGTLSIAFRTGGKKLKFLKGSATDTTWSVLETIDGKCCTSPVALAVTTSGAPRVAYGDGTSRAEGLKYGLRTPSGWKKTKVHGGRVKHVAMVLDKTPGLFGAPPSNGPHIVYVIRKKGTFYASKGSAGISGSWGKRALGKYFMPPDLTHHSNVTEIVFGNNGDLSFTRSSGGIWLGSKLSGGGNDSKPQLHGGKLTFSRNGGSSGVFFSQRK